MKMLAAVVVLAFMSGLLAGCAETPHQDITSFAVGTDALSEPLLRMALDPDFTAPELPPDLSVALSIWAPLDDPIPIPPAPAGPRPLVAALQAYAISQGEPVTDVASLQHDVDALGLDPAGETALARLVLAYMEASSLQTEALAGLSNAQAALVSQAPWAVSAWLAEEPGRDLWDLENETIRLLGHVDHVKTMQSADLLARAVEDARGHLKSTAEPPAPLQGVWATVHSAIAPLGNAPARAIAPDLSLEEALALLSKQLGIPAPEDVPELPPEVDHALAQIVSAHAAGAASDEPAWHAHWVLDAVRSAMPVLEGWQMSTSSQEAPACTEVPPAPGAPEVPSADDIEVPPSIEDPDVPGVPDLQSGHVLAIPVPSVGPDCEENPWLLVIGGPENDVHERAAVIRIDLGGDDTYLGEVAGPANITTGPPENRQQRSIGSIHVDLAGDDVYSTPDQAMTQGAASGGFSLLLDVEGNDAYEAGELSQGAACCGDSGGIGLLLDLTGDDEYTGGVRSQGFARTTADGDDDGTAGILLDVSGNDHYRFATQAWAEGNSQAVVQQQLRVMAMLWDVSGRDHYESTENRVSTDSDDDDLFSNQGQARDAGGSTFSTVAVFLDSSDIDRYTVVNLEGGSFDASDRMNNQERTSVDEGVENRNGLHAFIDLDPVQMLDADRDEDGTPNLFEELAGTGPDNSTDGGGTLFTDPGSDGGEAWLRAPAPGGVFLPNLAIMGPGDSAVTEDWFSFMVDLGGDDLYAAPNIGGVNAFQDEPPGAGSVTPRDSVALVLDVGDGTDTYRSPLDETTVGNLDAEGKPDRDAEIVRASPSLGGAVLGVAFLGDLGGANTFDSSITVEAIANQTIDMPRSAVSRAFGATQGGGLYGGVGMLATWDASNDFVSSVEAVAREIGGSSFSPKAEAFGVSQGGGWYGVGVLASFGEGDDTFSADVRTGLGASNTGTEIAMAAAQGAARNGAGILVDAGGDGSFWTNAMFAQGAGWTLAAGLEEPSSSLDSGNRMGTFAYPAIGILHAGVGDTSYQARMAAQGFGLGLREVPREGESQTALKHSTGRQHAVLFGVDYGGTMTSTQVRGLPAVGAVVDIAGQDEYRLEEGMGQGSATAGSVGVLIDAAGDDAYLAPNGGFVQGSARLAQALLLDLAGHDVYEAAERAQGFASDDPLVLLDARDCLGQPTPFGNAFTHVRCSDDVLGIIPPTQENAEEGAHQARGTLLAQFPTVAVLSDRQGIDTYRGAGLVQGVAEAHLQYAAQAGACKSKDVNVGGFVRQQVLPFFKRCEHRFNPESNPADRTERPWTAQDTSTPPSNAFLLGLFIDTSHTDLYDPVHDKDKKPLPAESEIPPDGNDWMWRQVIEPARNLDQTKLPEDMFDGEAEAGPASVDPEPADDPGQHVPSTPIPEESQAIIGLGVDRDTLGDATSDVLRETLGTLSLIQVDLLVAVDEDGTPLEEGVAQGLLHLFVDVQLPPGIEASLDRVDLLINRSLLGQADLVSSEDDLLRYHIPWDTTLRDEAGQTLYVDGTHGVQASIFVTQMASLESAVVDVPVNNPPNMEVDLDRNAISPALGHEAALSVDLTPDLKEPDGVPEDEQLESGELPGGFLEVTMEGPLQHTLLEPIQHVLLDRYVAAGPRQFTLDGTCGDDTCPDGLYEIRIEAEDSEGQTISETRQILIDGRAPTSQLEMPDVAGLEYRPSSGKVRVHWSFDDGEDTAGHTSGAENVALWRVYDDESLELLSSNLRGQTDVTDGNGVGTDDTLRFVTVATDALGNTEYGCLAGGRDEECAEAKLEEEDPHEITIDFGRPLIDRVKVTHEHIAPGITPVEFRAKITEKGSGLEFVRITFDDLSSYPLQLSEGEFVSGEWIGEYVFTEWKKKNGNLLAEEVSMAYAVTTRDFGDNRANPVSGTIILDEMPPRVNPLGTTYSDDHGVERPAGRPNSLATIRIDIQDAAVADVVADLSSLDQEEAACGRDSATLDPDDWMCIFSIEKDTPAGTYVIPISVTDKAGNVNATESALVHVVDARTPITDVEVVATGHDSATISWKTPTPTTSQVLYGKTSELGRKSPLELEYVTDHEVTVTELAPSTKYFFRAASQNEGGLQNESTRGHFTTLSALQVAFPEITDDQLLSGMHPLTMDITLLSGETPAALTIAAARQDDTGVVRRIGSVNEAQGPTVFELDTTLLGDGRYRIQVEAARGGDFTEALSPPVIIDNTPPLLTPESPLPGASMRSGDATVTVLVVDPLGLMPLEAQDVRILRNGTELATASAELEERTGSQDRLRVRLADPLPHGAATLRIELSDAAGNIGNLSFPVGVTPHALGPLNLSLVYAPGPDAARPDDEVTLLLTGSAARDLESATVAVAALDIEPLELVQDGDSWTAMMDVPDEASHGNHSVSLDLLDRFGTATAIADAARLAVDAEAPSFQTTRAEAQTPAKVRIQLAADEPVRLSVQPPDLPTTELDFATNHTFDLWPLTPGRPAQIDVEAWDRAGHRIQHTFTLTMPTDEQPPGGVTKLTATVSTEGVLLSWQPATDEAGIGHYLVQRELDNSESTTTEPRWLDDTAPYGQNVSYRVRAVDLAGNIGPDSAVVITRTAAPNLSEPAVDPARGPASKPFTFRITFAHPSGNPADEVLLRIGDRSWPMQLSEESDCTAGCVYETSVELPPGRQSEAPPEMRAEASWKGNKTIHPMQAPLVFDGDAALMHDAPDSAATPPAPIVWLLGMAILAGLLRRRRQ